MEENPPDEFILDYGRKWYNIRGHPAKLTKLVSDGIIRVVYKSRRYTHYKLTDREAVRKALEKCGV